MQSSAASLTGEQGGRVAAAIELRNASNCLTTVERLARELGELGLPCNLIDAVVIALEFHEMCQYDNLNAIAEFLAKY